MSEKLTSASLTPLKRDAESTMFAHMGDANFDLLLLFSRILFNLHALPTKDFRSMATQMVVSVRFVERNQFGAAAHTSFEPCHLSQSKRLIRICAKSPCL